jgi:hypothetical protein
MTKKREGPKNGAWEGLAPLPRQQRRDNNNAPYNRTGDSRLPLELPKPTAADIWRMMRPYGVWVCTDGREVLFSRDYIPLIERYPDQSRRAADPGEWVDWVEQRWFYKDGTPLKHLIMNAVLADWGLPPMPKKPSGYCNPSHHIFRRLWPNPYLRLLAH